MSSTLYKPIDSAHTKLKIYNLVFNILHWLNKRLKCLELDVKNNACFSVLKKISL